MKITYCMVLLNRLEEIKKAVRLTSPHVDRTIIIDGGSTDGSLDWLKAEEAKSLNVDVFVYPWEDNPPVQRNRYLEQAGDDGWVLVTDSDEYLEEPALYKLHEIVEEAENKKITAIRFRAHDIQTTAEGKVWENLSDYWNLMLFKMAPSVHYKGHTHVTLERLPGDMEDSKFRYFHIKSVPDQWFRGARNYWTTAVPAQNDCSSPLWKEFKALRVSIGLQYFYELAALMIEGQVPEELAQWIENNRDDENAEVRAYWNVYNIFLHPELNKKQLSNRDFPFIADRRPIKDMKF